MLRIIGKLILRNVNPLHICRKTIDVNTVAFPLCREQRCEEAHAIVSQRTNTCSAGRRSNYTAQGKHEMFVLKGGENILLFDPMEEPSQASSALIVIVFLCVDNA